MKRLFIVFFIIALSIFGIPAYTSITQAQNIPIAWTFTQPVTNSITRMSYLENWPYCNDEHTLGALHPALDLVGDLDIHAIAAGRVLEIRPNHETGFGHDVLIEHVLPSGEHIFSHYGHLNSIDVSQGTDVPMGFKIGEMGWTGNVVPQGPGGRHLHFEIRARGPTELSSDAWPTCYSIPKDGMLTPEQQTAVSNWINSGDIPRYTNPSSFLQYYTASDGVYLFPDSYYRGDGQPVKLTSSGYYNLQTFSNGSLNNKLSSFTVPYGWTVKLYEHPNKSDNGSTSIKYLEHGDITLASTGDTFPNGTPLNDNVSGIEVFINQCVGARIQAQSQILTGVSVAEAAPLSSPCDGNPTPTPGGPPLPTPPPASDGIQVVNIAPINVTPGTTFNPSITLRRTNGPLSSSDYLHAVPETSGNLFGAYPSQGVHYNVAQGNTYTFQYPEHGQFRMTAPQQTGTYQSVWRMHVGGVDVGPNIVIPITVATFSPPHPIDYWDMDVYSSKDLSGSVAYHTTTTDQYLFRDWGIGSPAGNVPVDNWSARFTREINFPGGDYHFHCQHDDGCRILIDGTTKLDAWWDSSFDGHDWTGTLTPGYHEVKVEYYDQGGGAHMDVWWQGPGFLPRYPSCEPDQWCADFWGNKSLQGSPPLTKNVGTAAFLDTGWSTGGPGNNLPTDYFSARFTRTLPFACGTYRFHMTADDGDRFYVDGALKLDEWTYKAQYTTDVDVQLSGGDHSLTIDYYENTGDTAMRLSWDQLMACAPYSGDLVVNAGQTLFADTIATTVNASATTATVGSSDGFDNGDTVLFHQTQGTANAGKWEQAVISSMAGTTWTLDHALTNAYSSSGAHAQVIKVPHYSTVTVQSGGTLTALPWNGSTGGVLMFRSDGTVAVNGTIDMTGKGYRGGDGSKRSLNHTGYQGESYMAAGIACSSQGCQTQHPNNNGGGGSGGYFAIGSGGGAGAGFGSAGAAAPTGNPVAGTPYGATTPTNLYLGSGGGGGYEDGNGVTAGNGGGGGGLIMIIAPTIQVSGAITSRGADGGSVNSYGGGGGAGGSIYLDATNTTIGTTKVTALGGNAGIATSGFSSGNGGNGGVGRIYLNSCNAVSGTTNPTANVQNTCTSATPTPTPGPTGVELLSAPWHLSGNNGDSQAYASIAPNALQGMTTVRITYDLHGLNALGNDASAIIFDQGGWKYISLSNYGQNGLNGSQTVTIPLSAFTGLNTGSTVDGLHTRFWYGSAFTVDITSIYVYGGTAQPTPTNTPTATPTRTPTPTNTPLPTATPTQGSGVELLSAPWNLSGNNGDSQAYESIAPNALAGKTMMRITYNLHGLSALGGDASAVIFDQGGWKYISLSNYGQNGLNGSQTITVPLSAFTGLNTASTVDGLHTRFWYGGSFTVDITSIVVY